MPENTSVNLSKQLTQEAAFAALFYKDQTIIFQDKVDGLPIHRRTPFGKVDLPIFCLNPFPNYKHTRRQTKNLLYRQGFTLEFDLLPLEFQKEWLYSIIPNPTVAVFSGNKSIHFLLTSTTPLNKQTGEEKEIIDLFKKTFPFVDFGVLVDPVKMCRVPGAIRPDNGKEQTILSIGPKFVPSLLIAHLKKYTQGIKKVPRKANANIDDLRRGNKKITHIVNGQKVSVELPLDQDDRKNLWRGLLRDLVFCGYTLSQDSYVYKAMLVLSNLMPENFQLDAEIETARQDVRQAEINKQAVRDYPKHAENTANLHEWIEEELKYIDIMDVLQRHTTIENEREINEDHSVFSCPLPNHADKRPSAGTYMGEKGYPLFHCSTCNITKNALQIAMEYGCLDFLSACKDVFGKLPPAWCKYCGQLIDFVANKPTNKDGTPHQCRKTLCCYCTAPIRWQDRKPVNEDGTPHICSYREPEAMDASKNNQPAQIEPDEIVAAIQAQSVTLDDFEKCEISKIQQTLEEIQQGDIITLSMATGTGKTFSMIQQGLKLASKGKNIVFITGTIANISSAVSTMKDLLGKHPEEFPGISESDLQIVVANCLAEDEELIDNIATSSKVKIMIDQGIVIKTKRTKKAKKTRAITYQKVVITTYGYAGRRGDSSYGYKQWHDMIENRVLFFDEAQILANMMKVDYPLATIYRRVGKEYHHCESCPKFAKKGDCRNCLTVYGKSAPAERTRERQWYNKFKGTNEAIIAEYVNQQESILIDIMQADPNQWQPLLDAKGSNIGNLFLYQLQSRLVPLRSVEMKENEAEADYIRSLLNTLVNPHLRQEMAIDLSTKESINIVALAERIQQAREKDEYENLNEEIKFPKQVCSSPRLCGFDSFVFWQLCGMEIREDAEKQKNGTTEPKIHKYNGAYAVVFATATFPKSILDHLYLLTQDGRFKNVKKICSAEVPAQFNVTLLSTEKRISTEKQIRIAQEILNNMPSANTLLVTGKAHDARRVDNILSHSHSKNVEFFEGRDFGGNKPSRKHCKEEERDIRTIVTYARSSIMTGENFPDYDIMIPDAEQFIPMAGIEDIKADMTPAQIQAVIILSAKQQLTQVVGRVLRSKKPLKPGETIQDDRHIVFLVHGLSFDFDIDEKLCIPGTYRHIHKTWQDKEEISVEAAFEAIKLAYEGKEPANYLKLYQQEIATKKTNALSKKQRKIAQNSQEIQAMKENIQEQQKQDNMADQWQKIQDAKNAGMTYSDIARKFNLARKERQELRERTKQLFDK